MASGLNNLSAGPIARTGNYTLMIADCLPRSLMEEDWTDNTDNVDRSIFPAALVRHSAPPSYKGYTSICLSGAASVGPHEEVRSLSARWDSNLFIQRPANEPQYSSSSWRGQGLHNDASVVVNRQYSRIFKRVWIREKKNPFFICIYPLMHGLEYSEHIWKLFLTI